MRSKNTAQWILILTASFAGFSACSTTKSEDESSLEAVDPAEAEPAAPVATEAAPDSSAASAATAPAAVAPTVQAPVDSSTATAQEAVSSQGTAAEARSTAGASINTSRHVMYVKTDGAAVRDQPNAKAKIVGTLSKGDHILVTSDGEWARTDDGTYISAKVLTDKGVGRTRRQASWGEGGAASESPKAKSGGKKSKAKKTAKKSPGKPSATESSAPAAEGSATEE